MLLALIAWFIAAACVVIGARRLIAVFELAREAEALLSELREARRDERSWSDQPRIARELGEVLSASSAEASVAALNERLGEVARELSVGAELPRVAARVGLFSGVILGIVELAQSLGEPSGPAIATSSAAVLAGISAAAVDFDLDRRARKAQERARDAWNAVSALLRNSGSLEKPRDGVGPKSG